MSDSGHDDTDKQLLLLEKRLMISYRQAAIGLREKLEKYLDKFEKEDAIQRALYDSGELSHDDYMAWRYKKIAGTKQWRDMLEQITTDMSHRNEIAASMINDTLPDVYALNHNYGTYEAEVGSGYDTTYTLYDKNTVKRLLTEHDDLLPKPRVDIPKDMRWNRQHIQSAVLQGILQGESMGKIAGRMMDVTDMNKKAAMRNARTAVTGAENAGRIDSYKRAQNMGINMKQMWMATLDARTRDSHAIMDGEQQEVGKKFSNGCRYPGDPQGAPGEIWNCRCTTVAMVEGADPYNPNLRPSEYLKEKGLTYEQWKEMHGERFYSKLFKDYDEPKRELSLAQQIAKGDFKDIDFNKVFNDSKTEGWTNWVGETKFDERITNIIAIMESRFPAKSSIPRKIDCTTDYMIFCDYADAPLYLPNGKYDRRWGGDAIAQVFNNTVHDGEINQSIVAFRRRTFEMFDYSMEDDINIRQKNIEKGEIIDSLANGPETTVIHEWGHVFSKHMDNAMIHSSETAKEYFDWYKSLSLEEKQQGISDYASTNKGEFEAECFLEMQMPNPRPLAVKWWSFMERILEEGY